MKHSNEIALDNVDEKHSNETAPSNTDDKHSNAVSLCDVELNKKSKVIDIKCSENELRRFLDLGIVKDTFITPIFKSPFGTPTAYEVRKTVLALRKETAEKVLVIEVE